MHILPLAFMSSQLGSCVGLTPCLLPWVKQIEFGQDRADRASQHTTHSCPIKPYSDVYRTPASGGSLPMAYVTLPALPLGVFSQKRLRHMVMQPTFVNKRKPETVNKNHGTHRWLRKEHGFHWAGLSNTFNGQRRHEVDKFSEATSDEPYSM